MPLPALPGEHAAQTPRNGTYRQMPSGANICCNHGSKISGVLVCVASDELAQRRPALPSPLKRCCLIWVAKLNVTRLSHGKGNDYRLRTLVG